MSYCEYIETMSPSDRRELHATYHNHHYGFPLEDDNELFGRLILEINQAGLSWETILRKEVAFRHAYDQFDIAKVAAYGEEDINRLLGDAGIIRNRLKIHAAVSNAQTILQIQKEFGSFNAWLNAHHPLALAGWVKLFKKTFRFTGGEIVNEFLMSIGYLKGAHAETCPVYQQVLTCRPMWARSEGLNH
ncbi:DNA-3-methyladenine glycosylase I [Ravibacter arvi]|uniref:DNA-3-methyladenine glycosylase I n=2 Tax=Ravibacter arvi TaxID=2051041 RepID=A0ABP8LR34_9BACT